MKVDILSDVHFDSYFPIKRKYEKEEVKKFFDPFFLQNNRKVGEVLILAGDIGHWNDQNIAILKIIKDEYYKYIVCVLGNHDYYLNRIQQDDYDENSYERVKEMRKLINAEDGMYCLDGNVIEINGVHFGGCDSSYSNAYIKKYFPKADHPKSNNEMWKRTMQDSSMMFGINQYNQLYKEEIQKIERIYQDCDVMITHVNPSYLKEHISPKFQNNITSTFFCFDGHRFLEGGTMKYWIFGHTHDNIEYEYQGVQCICNPLGYPSELVPPAFERVKSVEV
ncbi:metallophosphoesterase [Sulfurimonas sp. C5]|uniref:metallophosphoesterase n=1 Tax=Sulfurimonas sp. C5 TaxID=3036947 RepID=UPI0024558F93|nr:metallophosphoesterase [Sulfurimonas sp. C5]MDH4943965.1 metallophosphoesterase [Sulfurimonas sp. C5]